MRMICALTEVIMLLSWAGLGWAQCPGAGASEGYTPAIDLGGVIPERYAADPESCRGCARTINPAAAAFA
jgi:hypothetical protein